ncbi:GGDEF domain-containing protein [Tessaracoccus sp.]
MEPYGVDISTPGCSLPSHCHVEREGGSGDLVELDLVTLWFASGVIAATMLLLFYFVVYRTTRSAYSGWWCAALTLFLAGEGAKILDTAAQQYWAGPLGNMLTVLGAVSAWAAVRSLNDVPIRWWHVASAPALAGVVTFVDDYTYRSAGELVFFVLTPLVFGLGARELWRVDRGNARTRTWLAVGATAICAYYTARCVAFVVDGGGAGIYSRYFTDEVAGVGVLVFLVVVSFSMSILSNEQATKDLQTRATRDGLTGILNRAEFLRLAARQTRLMDLGGASATLILADLDNFKGINDTHGHQSGDRVLQAFAQAATRTVRSSDLVGRYGGDEFILLLQHTGLDRAEQVTVGISSMLKTYEDVLGFRMPTASYGITSIASRASFHEAIALADAGMYRAKSLSGDRALENDRVPTNAGKPQGDAMTIVDDDEET